MRALKNLSLSVLAITAAAFCFATTASAAEEIKAKFGTSLPDSHPQTLGARKFAELVDQKSKGRIKITVYSGAQLGSDQQMQAALRGGTQEFTAPSTATLANLVKEFGVFGLPFSFASEKQADAVFDGPFGQSMLAKLTDKDLIGLAFWENGFRHFTNSKHPVVKAEDLSGLPPAFIDVGAAEIFRDEAISYADGIWRAGGDAELHVWSGAFHACDIFAPHTAVGRSMIHARDTWVEKILAD